MTGTLRVRRLGYALGAEVSGVDPATSLDDETVAEIRTALLEHLVICIPSVDLTPGQLTAFCSRFGELDDNRSSPHLRHPDVPETIVLSNKPVSLGGRKAGGYGAGDKWHSDRSYTDHPSTLTFLGAKELPRVGGDTMFANMYAAYEALSPAFRKTIDGLSLVHDVALGPTFLRNTPEAQAEIRRRNPPVVHPIVTTHPETRRKALYVGDRARNIDGMTAEETQPILEFLKAHAVRYEFVYRHRWKLHDLLIWDNRCLLHFAVPDYDRSERRTMLRAALLGPKSGTLAG